MDTATLRRAVATPDGCLRNVTRIEIEVLDRRSLRWTLWEHDKRLCSLSARPGDVPAVLASTDAILRTMVGLDPAAAESQFSISNPQSRGSHGR